MKYLFSILLIMVYGQLFAQRNITGLVLSSDQNSPLEGASIQSFSSATRSDAGGRFKLQNVRAGDKAIITHENYTAYMIDLDTVNAVEMLVIHLDPRSNLLKDVVITGRRDRRADSLLMRKNFSSVFNYKGQRLEDAFVNRPASPPMFLPPNTPPNSPNTIATVDVVSLVNMLGKKQNPVSRLKKTLQEEEEKSYVSERFSKQKVQNITGLNGDSLNIFVKKYTPTVTMLKSMTEYDLISYIKESYQQFAHPVAAQQKKEKTGQNQK